MTLSSNWKEGIEFKGVETMHNIDLELLEETFEIRRNGNGAKPDANKPHLETAVREILFHIGEDPDREGLLRTPDRVARMYDELTAGYHTDPIKLINGAVFDVEYDDMVIVKDIEFYSMCEHHMLPFFGRAHVAYIPDGKVVGLSKIPRIVEMFARRLQVQERMTKQIAGQFDPHASGMYPRHDLALTPASW
jgi:GTP cyclohydrolase I